MSLSHEKPNLRDVVITAVRHGYCKVVEEAVKRSNKFEKEYNRFPPSPDDLLDFCHMLVMPGFVGMSPLTSTSSREFRILARLE